ncbi:hypothetical protein [Xenorhabdus szentirmaii]|uniref:Uncharacterized protein n=2 Tax=Xenorhabdus szentirmaii TaxID=290112 RepID=W1J4A0_9GAMM|nr:MULTISPECIES: hypothetical protein [Xenorhabdus]MBD2779148.1 hypothetical protein [Xenorhabdus sp. 38]MBD2793310.1 hypothetical protein [Xenorhabdus sp. CUL]MBD2799048.1 hypothetical protein [Xenorhabdus sp. M]MBD2803372.1 hypothetical protein [Xenorhabdus sp. ZM]MBD2820093.1 hypothetical protein [Xenorhabdus sp. 42]
MSGPIVTDGDILQFDPQFGHRQVRVTIPGKINGTGHAQINGKKVCILGDEKRVTVSATYTTITHMTPGIGTLTISLLDISQQALQCTSGAVLIIKGKKFTAMFTPRFPAMNNTVIPPQPDILTPSLGSGIFIPQQNFATVN